MLSPAGHSAGAGAARIIRGMKLLAYLAAAGVSTAVAVSAFGLPVSSTPAAVAVEPAASTSTTTTTVAMGPAPVAPEVVPTLAGLARGAEGADVVRLQELLVQLHYDPGPVDGPYGAE